MTKKLNIYRASAGSGKTRTLVKEYLTLAFEKPGNYRHILAITFTNKATDEMKARVVEYLERLAEGKDEKLASEILGEMKKRNYYTKDISISKKASEVLSSILHDYSNFNISTIDSFCIRIIRSFAKELGLPVGFTLELDTDYVLEELTAALLDKVGSDEVLTRYISEFIESRMDDEKSWEVEHEIKEFGRQIVNEKFWLRKINTQDDVYDDKDRVLSLINDIRQVKYNFESSLKSRAVRIVELIEGEGLTYDDLKGKTRTSILKYCENLSSNIVIPSKTLLGYFDSNTFFNNPSKIESEVYSLFAEINDILDNNLRSYYTACVVFKTIFSIGILGDLLGFLESFRKNNRTILSTDVNSFLRLLISDDISPFIYEKIGVKLKYFLLDEFQDTSRFQWDNLRPLVINSLSEQNNSLIVGDVKQSIYRWRNGDMRLLLSDVRNDLSAFESLIEDETLEVNWRSHKEIIEFNNAFFMSLKNHIAQASQLNDDDYLMKSYHEKLTVQKPSGMKNGGYVEVNFFETDKDSGINSNEQSEMRVIEIINNDLKENYKLGDILVLVRENKESRVIAGVLASAGIPAVSEHSLLLKTSPAVNFIVAALRFLNDSRNRLSRTVMLHNFLKMMNSGIDAVSIFNDSLEQFGKIFLEYMPDEFFKEEEKPKRLPVLYNLTVYELVEHIISIFGLGSEGNPYVIKFLDEAGKFTQDKDSGVNLFLRYWEDNKHKLSISLPDDSGSVKIMTVHKAKGLESKVVIIPYANWGIKINGGKDKIWASASVAPFNQASAYFIKAVKEVPDSHFAADFHDEERLIELDSVNLLYVSMTRPEERLYLNVPIERNSSIANVIKAAVENIYADKIKDNRLSLGSKEFSEPLSVKEKENIIIERKPLHSFNANPYFKKLFIRPSYRKLKVFENERMKIKTDNGVVVHKILSYIVTKDDIESALNKSILEGIILSADIDKFRKLILKAITSPEAKPWFDGSFTVKPESEILTTDNRILRPDRVMLKDDRAVIVDYKTGREEDKHSAQLNEYAKILSEMGYSKIEKYLLYINDYKDEININVKRLNGANHE